VELLSFTDACLRELGFATPSRPSARVGAFVRIFDPMLLTKGFVTTLAYEWQEVDLIAVFQLAVLPYEGCVVLVVHCAIACLLGDGIG